MSREIEVILDECLAWLAAGASLDSCLARYPDRAEELRPLLELTLAVRATPAPQARPAAVHAGRQRMLKTAAAKQRSQAVSKSGLSRYAERIIIRITGKENPDMKLVTRLALATFVVAVLIVGGGVTAASANALPGDALYPVKLTVDDLRLSLTGDPAARAQLEQQLQAARQQEVQAVLQQRRATDVHFTGILTAQEQSSWIVGGLRINLDASTQVIGQPTIGAMAEVWASTQPDGTILARRLAVRGAPAMTPTPHLSPLPTPTRMPTHEPTHPPMPTHEPTHDPMPTMMPTVMLTHEPTHEPMPTHEPTHEPMPTHEPTLEPTHESGPMPTHQPEPMPTSWPHH
jgi:hypothetical protein